MSRIIILRAQIFIAVVLAGCASQSDLYLEKMVKEEMSPLRVFREVKAISLVPESKVSTKKGVQIEVTHSTPEFLDNFFSKDGPLKLERDTNPYPEDIIVFHVKISNQSGGKISLDPEKFVLLDDKNNQYKRLSPDYITGLCSSRSTTYSIAKMTGDTAPGIYGAPARVAGTLAMGNIRRRSALIKYTSLNAGPLFNAVVYDGFLAFLQPEESVRNITLIMPGIHDRFNAADMPVSSLEFRFAFQSTR